MILARMLLAAALAAAPGLAAAEEAHGCEGFRWSVETQRAALVAAGKPVVHNGGALAYDAAATLALAPLADAALPRPPERAPKFQPSFAGHFTLPAPPKPGVYVLTLSAAAWIDVADGGSFLHPKAFSGAVGCEGARKTVKFDLPARPLDVQVSGVANPEIAVILTAE